MDEMAPSIPPHHHPVARCGSGFCRLSANNLHSSLGGLTSDEQRQLRAETLGRLPPGSCPTGAASTGLLHGAGGLPLIW